MFNERSLSDQRISHEYCETHYGHYGVFASLPLLASVVETQTYSVTGFKSAFQCSGQNHSRNSSLAEFINNLTYDDKDYFAVEETRFLLQLLKRCEPVTDERLEVDQKALSREARHGTNMLKSHAKILLKALNFWKLRFKDKCAEWRQKYIDADEACVARRRAQNGFVDGNGANGNVVDEGYQSGHDLDSYYSDFDDDDEDNGM